VYRVVVGSKSDGEQGNRLVFGASGGIEDIFNCVVKFNKQCINLAHHLHLHFECSSEAQ